MQLLYQLLLVLLINIIFVIISHSYRRKLVHYYNGFETVSYSKAKDLSIIVPVFSHTTLTTVFNTCLRVTGLRHMNPFDRISPWFNSARARPCGANVAAGLHTCAAHRVEEEDACTFSHMWQKMLSPKSVKAICATTTEQIWGSLFNGSSTPQHFSQTPFRSN